MLYAIKEFLVRLEGKKEKGQTLIEYALIAVLIAVVVIALLTTTGTSINAVFQDIVDELGAASG